MKNLYGKALLDDSSCTKSTAFTREERQKYGLRGLLPYDVANISKQKERALENMRCKTNDIEKYIGWLLKYDEIVDYLRNIKVDESLTYEKGAVIVPDKFPFKNLVPNATPGEEFERRRKAYFEAYYGAVNLIQTTPDIVFSPSRT